MGGTWDLFQYPGIRSDSDMYTLGYSFRPWKSPKAIADGPDILQYIKDTSKDGNIDQHIIYNRKVHPTLAISYWLVAVTIVTRRGIHQIFKGWTAFMVKLSIPKNGHPT